MAFSASYFSLSPSSHLPVAVGHTDMVSFERQVGVKITLPFNICLHCYSGLKIHLRRRRSGGVGELDGHFVCHCPTFYVAFFF